MSAADEQPTGAQPTETQPGVPESSLVKPIRPRARLVRARGADAWKHEAALQRRHRLAEAHLHRNTQREMKLVGRLLRHMRREMLYDSRSNAVAESAAPADGQHAAGSPASSAPGAAAMGSAPFASPARAAKIEDC
jgi:hypothetical protein